MPERLDAANHSAPALDGQQQHAARPVVACDHHPDRSLKRWVGLGVIADNLINIGQAIAKQPAD
jgi:hypothetical protein